VAGRITVGSGGRRQVRVRAGNQQSTRVGRLFPAQLTVSVVDGHGERLAGVRVTFRVASGDAAFGQGARAATSTTGATGVATSQVLTAGGQTGAVRVTATASIVAQPTVFALRVLPEMRGRPGSGLRR
jgi:hypothetical protein